MNVVYSFIGKMPDYVETSVKQLRLFFDGDIYLIYNDISDKIRANLESHGVKLVDYDLVKSERFFEREKKQGFEHVPRLGDRAQLFMRSYERFYLLHNLMVLHNLQNIWFMELDIMMYMNPTEILPMLDGRNMAYAYQRPKASNSGVFFVREALHLNKVLDTFDICRGDARTEMEMLWVHYMNNPDIAMFPLCSTPCESESPHFWKDHGLFGDILFDGAILGVLYFGYDAIHTGGKIVPQITNVGNVAGRFLNIWKHGELIWETNDGGLSLPYFVTKSGKKYKIANLHIHSKALSFASSEKTDHTLA
jgi:hypothetical protein